MFTLVIDQGQAFVMMPKRLMVIGLLLRKKKKDSKPWMNKKIAQGMIYTHVNKMIEHALNYIHPWLIVPYKQIQT